MHPPLSLKKCPNPGSSVRWRRSASVVSVSRVGLVRGWMLGRLIGSLCLCCLFHLPSVGCFCLVFQPPLYHIWVGDADGEVPCGEFLCLCPCIDLAVAGAPPVTRADFPVGAVLSHWDHPGPTVGSSILRVCLGPRAQSVPRTSPLPVYRESMV